MTTGAFDSFVVLAEMRTGSNALEDRLNRLVGVACFGELFNPNFIGHPKQDSAFGVTQAQRDRDPACLIQAMQAHSSDLPGFRLFSNHDDRVYRMVMDDPRCAKIILTRPAIDSFISLQIAKTTGQWWLGDVKNAKAARVSFDAEAFDRYDSDVRSRQAEIRRTLRASGQTAFELSYDELQDEVLLGGLARFLGVTGDLDDPERISRVQNPGSLKDKVRNFRVLEEHMKKRAFVLDEGPRDLEPERAAAVRSYLVTDDPAMIFIPTAGGPVSTVEAWMTDLAGVAPAIGLTQKDLRKWKRQHKGHRTFAVLRHPVRRAFAVYQSYFGHAPPDDADRVKAALATVAKGSEDPVGFDTFLKFLKQVLDGQSALRANPSFASQSAVLSGAARFAVPDVVVREEDLSRELPRLIGSDVSLTADPDPEEDLLAQIYTGGIEAAVKAAYQRDYMTFGLGPWRP